MEKIGPVTSHFGPKIVAYRKFARIPSICGIFTKEITKKTIWEFLPQFLRITSPGLNKENLFVLCSLLNSRNYFWNEYFNLPFLDICRIQFLLLTSFVSSWYRKAEIALWMSLRNKKMINYEKRFIKQPVIKQSSTFLRVSFLAGENLKKLIEIFRQEVSNVIFTFLDHLKPNIFFVGQLWWPTQIWVV